MMEGPVCLVEVTPSGGLSLNPEGLEILRSLDDALEVVAIFGPKDTGKSFLLDQIPGKEKSFGQCRPWGTKAPGIWMRCLPHPMGRDTSLVLLDTDGFRDEDDPKVFAWLFMLDILTSSVFVYNTRTIGGLQEELMQLKYMDRAHKMVCVDASFPEDTSLLLQGILPEFVCCMRDVPADPQMEEEMLAANHSLDFALGHDEDTDVPLQGYRLFPKRKLFHFSHPCSSLGDQDLDMLPQDLLDPYFQGQVSRFWDYVLSRMTKTTLGNRTVNGKILAGFFEHYVNCLARDEVIVLSELCGFFEEDISTFQQMDRVSKLKEKRTVEPRRAFNACQYSPEKTPQPKKIRALPHLVHEPQRETITLSQNAAAARASHIKEEEIFSMPGSSSSRSSQRPSYSTVTRSHHQWSPGQSKAPVPTMDKPLCLIENLPNEGLQVNQEALDILSGISQPVVVVAIVGLYRTGKSYLMNKLAGKQTGFSLGATIQSHTKGIWMWVVPHPQKPNHALVLLDTEGLGDVEKGDSTNDSWIFALAVLLSSTFVYNSMVTIDYQAMEQLHYVTELTERIKVRSARGEGAPEEEDSEFISFFPAFVWAVRDFTLGLVLNGRAITEDEYLENALKLHPEADSKRNMPKQYIRRYFPTRKCFVFDCPANKKKLAIIETLQDDELEPDFVTQTQKFCHYIHGNANTKTIKGGHIVTGTLLGNLALTYVDAIRSGTIPCMENAVLALAQIENSAAVQEALAQYVQGMENAAREQFPTDTMKEFMFLHTNCQKEALQVFLDRSFKDDDEQFLEELADQVEAKCKDFQQRNDQASSDRCLALLLEDKETLEEMVSQGAFAKRGGYQHFMEAQKQMVDAYNFTPSKGLKADQVLHEVLKSQETTAQTVLQMDSALDQKEKEAAEERARAEALEREARVRQEMLEQSQQMLADQERAHREHTQKLQQKMDEDRRKLIHEQEMVVARKLQEQQRLLQEGFNKESARLSSEIQRVQQQIPRPQKKSKCVIS
ncbi:guanylate-binding protein 3-like [Lissotriton helveticus]